MVIFYQTWTTDVTEIFNNSYRIFGGHSDAITAIAFTPDSNYLVTACSEGTWRLFDDRNRDNEFPLILCEEGHDLGVQGSDFSPVLEPLSLAGKFSLIGIPFSAPI